MDGLLINRNVLIKRFDRFVGVLYKESIISFYKDEHIDYLLNGLELPKKLWLNMTFSIYDLLREYIHQSYPNLKIMICFTLCVAKKSKIPKTLTLRNFQTNMITPPELLFFTGSEFQYIGKDPVFLSTISMQYGMRAYYVESCEDVVYRWIYLLD